VDRNWLPFAASACLALRHVKWLKKLDYLLDFRCGWVYAAAAKCTEAAGRRTYRYGN